MSNHAKHLPLLEEDPVAVAEDALAGAAVVVPRDSRDISRSRRKREVRAKTISVKRMTKRELELGRLMYPPEDDVPRPTTRSECQGGERPCPFVSCENHLYLDVSAKTGAIKVNFPDLEPHEMRDSCALDVADRGGETLENVGAIMNLTRERIRQVEVKALAKIQALTDMTGLRDYAGEGPQGKRRLPVLLHGDGDDAAPDPDGVEVGVAGASITEEYDWDSMGPGGPLR